MATSPHTDRSVMVYAAQLEEQPKWKMSINTWVALAVGVTLQVITILLDSNVPLPEPVANALPIVSAIITGAGLKLVKNGRTKRGLEDLQRGMAEYVDRYRGCGDLDAHSDTQAPVSTPAADGPAITVPADPLRVFLERLGDHARRE